MFALLPRISTSASRDSSFDLAVTARKGRTGRGCAEQPLDILLLGPVPPPLGGISVHISRIVELVSAAGYRVAVLNHFSAFSAPFVVGVLDKNPLKYLVETRRRKARLVHYHHSRWPHLLAVALGRRRSGHYVATIHAGDLRKHFPQLISRNPVIRALTVWALKRFDTIVVVNPAVLPAVQAVVGTSRVRMIPAFIPPIGHSDLHASYDARIVDFLKGGRVVAAVAYSIQFMPTGDELYGVDVLVRASLDIAAEAKDARLAIFIAERPATRRASTHLAGLEAEIAARGLEARVLVIFGEDFVPALEETSVFVRPTRADGDALSIREALNAGVRVYASDVTTRPEGVILFPVGDTAALACLLEQALRRSAIEEGPLHGERPRAGHAFAEEILDVYDTALGHPARHT